MTRATKPGMQLFLITSLVMIAFASNSLLTRVGVFQYGADPFAFAALRTAAGAAMLVVLILMRGSKPQINRQSLSGAAALAVYMLGFSWAYLQLDAGLGALILFGVMQITMFAYAAVTGQNIPPMRWLGAAVAFVGLALLLWPTGSAPVPTASAVVMAAAGIGWALYTLIGQGASQPLLASASNFVLCLPIVLGVWVLTGQTGLTLGGAITAVMSGAITSGLGYALWYRTLPQLPTTVAAVTQLSVPVIAILGGVALLSEPLTLRLLIASALVIGGIALSILRKAT